MSARFVLDEFDVNLSSLATRLIIVIIVVVGSSANARTFDSTGFSTIAVTSRVAEVGRMVVWIGDVGHFSNDLMADLCLHFQFDLTKQLLAMDSFGFRWKLLEKDVLRVESMELVKCCRFYTKLGKRSPSHLRFLGNALG